MILILVQFMQIKCLQESWQALVLQNNRIIKGQIMNLK